MASLAGTLESGTVSEVYATDVTVAGVKDVGGLVGFFGALAPFHARIVDSYATGTVSPRSATSSATNVGGLVGRVVTLRGTVSRSYAESVVTGTEAVGGLVGRVMAGGTVSDSYADSVVTGAEQDSGGLVGKAQGATITRSYAVGVVADTGTHVGGLVGRIEDMPAYVTTVVNSFYDTATTGQTASAGGTGKTTSEMQQQATFTGWDFSSIWAINPAINGGYPYLRAIALQ